MILFAVFSNSICGVIRGCCVGNWCDPFCKEKFSEIRTFLKLQAQASACRWLTHMFTLKKVFLGCNGNEVVQELCNFLLVCDVLYFVTYLWEVKSDYGGTSRVSFWLIMGKNLNFSLQLHPFVNQVFAQAWWRFFITAKPLFFLWTWKSPCFCLKGLLFLITEFMGYYQNSFPDCTCCCCRALLRSQVHTPGVLLLLFGGEAVAGEAVLMEGRAAR